MGTAELSSAKRKVGKMTVGLENRKHPLYMFDVDFDEIAETPEPLEEVECAPPPPTFSAEELAAAREEGQAAGLAEGIAQTKTGLESQIAEILAAMAQTLTTLEDAQHRANEETARAAVRLAAAAAARLMPEYAKRHGLAEIEAFIAQCLSDLFEGTAVTIHVPEALADEIGERIGPIARRAGFDEGLKLVADPELGASDCRIDWNDGGAMRNAAKLTAEIDDIVEKFLERQPDPTPPTDPQSPAEEAPTTTGAEPGPAAPAEQISPAQTVTAEPETAPPPANPATAQATAEPDEAVESPPPVIDAATPPPPANPSTAPTTAAPDEAAITPPPIVDASSGDGETMDVPESPETGAPAAEPAPAGDAAANPAAEAMEPEEPQAPAAGPVLPGAVDTDPSTA